MVNRLLIHTNDAGEVFVNEQRVEWMRYADGRLYVRPHPGAVFVRASDGAVFFSRSLSYGVWDFVDLIVSIEAALGLASSVQGRPGGGPMGAVSLELEGEILDVMGVELVASEATLEVGIEVESELALGLEAETKIGMEMEVVVAGGA